MHGDVFVASRRGEVQLKSIETLRDFPPGESHQSPVGGGERDYSPASDTSTLFAIQTREAYVLSRAGTLAEISSTAIVRILLAGRTPHIKSHDPGRL